MNKGSTIKVEMTWGDFLAAMRVVSRLEMEEAPEPSDLATLKAVIDNKLERMLRHELYSKFKSAPTAEEREAARQAYLAEAGIAPDWRW